MMGGPASHPSEPDSPPGLRMAFEEAIQRGKLIGVNLEVFGLGVDSHVLVILLILDVGTHDPFENFLPGLGEFR